ncbi:hypothetical protein SS37A_38370 (plasmid) [Methylocystis iwaonis]|uniref:Uncharacterized protein n=1 Tax=Methylocystis iwaonis TaxID=2885079 RepID=A0ABM8EE49_9HYPH|nr:hypothetical protein SS37A_38370 [Methylocystis iwaonis]
MVLAVSADLVARGAKGVAAMMDVVAVLEQVPVLRGRTVGKEPMASTVNQGP